MHKTTNTVGGGQVGAVAFRKAGLITIGLLVGAMGCATMSQSGSGGAPVEKYSATVQVGSGAARGMSR